ncbi:MAG: hypothetical protein Fur0037_10280 [Planctomycetota bacterium]
MADFRDAAPLSTKDAWGLFLTGFVPGLLQIRLGEKKLGASALLSCLCLFFAGFWLVQDRIFYYALVSPERNGEEATWLTTLASLGLPITFPEFLNLPATVLGSWWTFDSSFEGERLWRLPRDLEHLGSFLTAASGMLAAFWSADAFWRHKLRRNRLAPGKGLNPAVAAGMSWLLPGLAHAKLGQKGKGILITLCMLLVFALGMIVSEGYAIDRGQAPIWWMGQQLFGGGALLSALVFAPLQTDHYLPGLELGLDLTTVAGFLNLVIMVDAYTIAERQGLASASEAAS